MNPQYRKKCRLQVETLEGRIALSSGVPTSGLEGVHAVPALVAPESGGASTLSTRPTLHLGSRGKDVVYLQETLKVLGYNIGSAGVDGTFGRDTEGAVIRFQRNHNLQNNGIVGPQTWEKLEGALTFDKTIGGFQGYEPVNGVYTMSPGQVAQVAMTSSGGKTVTWRIVNTDGDHVLGQISEEAGDRKLIWTNNTGRTIKVQFWADPVALQDVRITGKFVFG
jgi:hypothetical protein